AVAAAAVAVALGVAVRGGGDEPAAPPAAVVAMTPVGQDELTATISLQGVAWGTRMHLACTEEADDEAADTTYALVVTDADGGTQQVATWRGLPGRTAELDAATDLDPDQIAAIEVVVVDTGEPVLTHATTPS
ncbi:hypothetical protein ABLM29_19760, partial [Nocardioides sp. YIM 152588]